MCAATVAIPVALVSVFGAAGHQPPLLAGLDHVPIAVRDLEQASRRYQALGFSLKPGRVHANGIRNQHVKFSDGTELELITAPDGRDRLTRTYRRHLEAGDGPAFLALFAPDPDRLEGALSAARRPFQRNGAMITVAGPDPLDYLFFGPRNQSPTDRPDHLAHANGAESLIAVWLAGERSAERALLRALGVSIADQPVHVPGPGVYPVARLGDGRLVFLPEARQVVPGRPIVGVTLRVRAIGAARRVLDRSGVDYTAVDDGTTHHLFVPPAAAHGLWLDLRGPA